MSGGGEEVLGQGRYLRLVRRDEWEHVERPGITGIVVIVAVTDDGRLVLNEQYRKPVRGRVIELPAGLAGDVAATAHEPIEAHALRELWEETGYEAAAVERLIEGPVSAGMSSEVLSFFLATGLRKTGPGGGDAHENIEVFTVPVQDVEAWIRARVAAGSMVDPKVMTGVWYAERYLRREGRPA